MRILFYLPVVTPWWFREVITPMLRALHRGGGAVELHVMVAPLWRNTGLQPDDLLPAADLDEAVHWHIIDQGEPEQFRLSGAEVPGLLDQVNRIDPDITLARSADFAISRQFPGVVRYIMEGAAPPFGTDPEHVVLDERPFAPAEVPAHAATLADAIAERLRPSRDLVQRRPSAGAPAMLRERLGLPSDRRVVAIPLQYAHEENFFLHHAGFPDGLALIGRLLAELDESVVLAFVDHPQALPAGACPARRPSHDRRPFRGRRGADRGLYRPAWRRGAGDVRRHHGRRSQQELDARRLPWHAAG
jgi:hypothetical protein